MKKIIIPTDFSDNSHNALRYAVQLYAGQECTFYLMHTYTPAIYQTEYVLHSPAQIGLGDIYQTNALEHLEEQKEKIEKEFKDPKHKIITHCAFNILTDEVLDMSRKEGADLVIMGTQGATGAKEIFLGTHTVHLIKKACCPVIAVPSGFEFEKPREILFPTDYEVEYKQEKLEALLHLASLHMASIEVLHISTGYEPTDRHRKNQKLLDTILEPVAHLFHDYPSQEIIDGINKFQEKTRVQLLVMIQNKHTFLEKLFIEPVIKKIGFHVTIPFMVIPGMNNN